MSNKTFKYVVVATNGPDNRGIVGDGFTSEYEIKSTTALRAANKARKAHAETQECPVTEVQVLDSYRPE